MIAPVWKRAAAIFVDGLLFLPFVYFETFLYEPGVPVAVVIGGLLTAWFGYLFYDVYLHGRYGQTVGKMVLGIRVVRTDDSPIGFGRALFRAFVAVLFGAAFFLNDVHNIVNRGTVVPAEDDWIQTAAVIVYAVYYLIAVPAVALSNRDRRTVHDFLAGTKVTAS
jgi:uncharacterized RDD family membrane protein YckC